MPVLLRCAELILHCVLFLCECLWYTESLMHYRTLEVVDRTCPVGGTTLRRQQWASRPRRCLSCKPRPTLFARDWSFSISVRTSTATASGAVHSSSKYCCCLLLTFRAPFCQGVVYLILKMLSPKLFYSQACTGKLFLNHSENLYKLAFFHPR